MRYAAKRGQKAPQAPAPIEVAIPLLEPVTIYTAKELAAMPLSKMNEAIAAQEAYFIIEHTTQMGGGCSSNPSRHAGWCCINSSQRKVQNTLQAQQRIYRTSNRSPVGKAWSGEIGWGIV